MIGERSLYQIGSNGPMEGQLAKGLFGSGVRCLSDQCCQTLNKRETDMKNEIQYPRGSDQFVFVSESVRLYDYQSIQLTPCTES